jgi:creatinine amidohydrolase
VPLFADLTFEELKRLDPDRAVVLVPTGCTEQQGPHLGVGFDTWFASELCDAVAERLAEAGVLALVLPTLPFGPTPEHRGYGSGYINLRQETFEALLEDVLDSLVEQGFRRIVIWRGCGGHRVAEVVSRVNAAHAGCARVWVPEHPYHEVWCSLADPAVPGGHADSFATSIALARHPERVRPDRVPAPSGAAPDFNDPDADWSLVTPSGVVGDPTHASAELGQRLWTRTIEQVAAIVEQLAAEEIPDSSA